LPGHYPPAKKTLQNLSQVNHHKTSQSLLQNK
jgi:hypothetical protein